MKAAKNSAVQTDETANELRAELIAALQAMDDLVEGLWKAVPWGKTFLEPETLQLLNEAPGMAKRALAKAKGK